MYPISIQHAIIPNIPSIQWERYSCKIVLIGFRNLESQNIQSSKEQKGPESKFWLHRRLTKTKPYVL